MKWKGSFQISIVSFVMESSMNHHLLPSVDNLRWEINGRSKRGKDHFVVSVNFYLPVALPFHSIDRIQRKEEEEQFKWKDCVQWYDTFLLIVVSGSVWVINEVLLLITLVLPSLTSLFLLLVDLTLLILLCNSCWSSNSLPSIIILSLHESTHFLFSRHYPLPLLLPIGYPPPRRPFSSLLPS